MAEDETLLIQSATNTYTPPNVRQNDNFDAPVVPVNKITDPESTITNNVLIDNVLVYMAVYSEEAAAIHIVHGLPMHSS